MDWLDKLQVESAVRNLKESFQTIRQITGAYDLNLSTKDNLQIHIGEKHFDELCRTFNKVACLEMFQDADYPYRRHIIVDGVEFFALTQDLEELREVS